MIKITDALMVEHATFRAVFDHIERTLPDLKTLEEAKLLAGLIEGLLASHGRLEEDIVMPALDHARADKGHVQRLHVEHQEIDGRLRNVQTARNCAEACQALQEAMHAAREHFSCEERGVFPQMEKLLRADLLRELGKAWHERRSGVAA